MKNISKAIAKASNGNPVLSTLTVILFYIMFNTCMATVEVLIYGERFTHWLDPIVQIFFCSWSAYCVFMCAEISELAE